ncbi:MAG: hypothetical protein HYS05_03885 [Acidobacteria bacterium]|nr:hypothetical protein [Acidobacteriota bacterium]
MQFRELLATRRHDEERRNAPCSVGHHAPDFGALLDAVNASVLRTDRGDMWRGFGH